MSATNYLEDKFLQASLTGATYTGAANVYLALYSTAPGEAGGGTELSGSGYAREEVVFTVDTGNGAATNTGNVSIGPATADWTTAVAYGIVDAATAGNILYTGGFAIPQTIRDGLSLEIGIGNITITIS
jgi:hypothetical protein